VFAERYLYLPSIGFCWIVAWGAAKLWSAKVPALARPLSRAVPLLLGVVALMYALSTVARNRDWRSEDALFRRTLEQGDSSMIRSNLGAIYFNNGDLDHAEHEWLESLSAGPTNVFVLDNLAILRRKQQRYVESLDFSWRALRARPAYTIAHANLAETLVEIGRTPEAEWQFRIATALSPLSTRAHNSYGKFLFNAGRLDDARIEYERSAAVDPTTEACDRLGDIYVKWQDRKQAEQAFRRAIALNPFDNHAHFGLGQILEEVGRPGDALHEIESGLAMDPTDPAGKAAAIRLRGNTPSTSQTVPQ
jgi:Flp pilus assembly protein TadD